MVVLPLAMGSGSCRPGFDNPGCQRRAPSLLRFEISVHAFHQRVDISKKSDGYLFKSKGQNLFLPVVQKGSIADKTQSEREMCSSIGFRLLVLLKNIPKHFSWNLWQARGSDVSSVPKPIASLHGLTRPVGTSNGPPAGRRPGPTCPWYVKVFDPTDLKE